MSDFAVRLLESLVEIYSPSGREAPVAGRIQKWMKKELGFQRVWTDRVGNVFGAVGRWRPHVLLASHMDTVPGRLKLRITKGRLHGRGAVDAKASLAAMLMAAAGHRESGHVGSVTVAALVDEEGRSRGVKELLRSPPPAEYVVFGEPSGSGRVTVGYKGRVALRVTCRTRSAHASAPWLTRNAVEEAWRVYERIRAWAASKTPEGSSRYRSISAVLTRIRGGVADNVVPGRAWFDIDIRIPPGITATKVGDDVTAALSEDRAEAASIMVQQVDATDAFEVPISSPLVRAFARAVLRVRHQKAELVRKTGTGDMNVLGRALSVPVVTYGPGDARLSHSPEESIDLAEYRTSIEVLSAVLDELTRAPK